MGLLDRLFKRISIPQFSVSIYGKLPCHKEYLQVGGVPGFLQLRQVLDRGFEARISSNLPRPHVLPDRRLFVAVEEKVQLVGCIFESDDGIRAFPFLMVAPFPSKFFRLPEPQFWQCLEQMWSYLEAYYQDLRQQPSAEAFYNRVRGIVHELPPFAPVDWPEVDREEPEREGVLQTIKVTEQNGDLWLAQSAPIVNPNYILCPVSHWSGQVPGPTYVYLGRRGLEDVDVGHFLQAVREPEAGEVVEAPVMAIPVPAPLPPEVLEAETKSEALMDLTDPGFAKTEMPELDPGPPAPEDAATVPILIPTMLEPSAKQAEHSNSSSLLPMAPPLPMAKKGTMEPDPDATLSD